MTQAEQYYAEKKLIEAEEWFQKARNNRSLRYKEELLSLRLQELSPITSMKQSLASLDSRLNRLGESADFSGFMNVYAELLDTGRRLAGDQDPYASYYGEIADFYGIPDDVNRIFLQFISMFYRQAEDQLHQEQYVDNSFKWNLLAVPESFYGGEVHKQEKLLGMFQRHDETIMKRLAAGGKYTELLDWSYTMSSDYESHSVPASWVHRKTDELVHTMLQRDVQLGRPSDFVSHANSYKNYLSRTGQQGSDNMGYIQNQINRWLTAAQGMVKVQNYEGAVALYEALSGYQDVTGPLQAAQLAWTIHDPSRLLILWGGNGNFQHVSGGGKRFGGLAYAIGSDDNNVIYLAIMQADESIQLFQNHDFPVEVAIQQLSIEESLSTEASPVILVEGSTGSNLMMYSAYEAHNANLNLMFQFTADGYQVQPDKSLLVTSYEGASTDEIAMLERQGDQYQFTGFRLKYTDIAIADIENHLQERVRFSINILKGGYGEALAEQNGHYVMLRGEWDFTAGKSTMIGTFSEFQSIELPGSQDPPVVDPAEPETGQVDEGSMEEPGNPSETEDTETSDQLGNNQQEIPGDNGTEPARLIQVPVIVVESIE
ncbi:hypothetical protein JCM10914_4889 [Paenibacillus sp. JCM 10914]|nr:hypothetical protein JCM10914_4889 [Paenibacillus sp. JCM 10914]